MNADEGLWTARAWGFAIGMAEIQEFFPGNIPEITRIAPGAARESTVEAALEKYGARTRFAYDDDEDENNAENTSGTDGIVPPEVLSLTWNWGAFLITPFWLMGHNMIWIGIVMIILGLIPHINIALLPVPFVFGAIGNRLAWQKQRFSSFRDFQSVQAA